MGGQASTGQGQEGSGGQGRGGSAGSESGRIRTLQVSVKLGRLHSQVVEALRVKVREFSHSSQVREVCLRRPGKADRSYGASVLL